MACIFMKRLVVSLFFSCCYCKDNIYIGVLLSLSLKDGGWSAAGTLPGVMLAIEDINNSSDILKDYHLNPIIKDNKCDRGYGTYQFVNLLQDKRPILMLLGGGCSRSTEVIAEASPNWNLVEVNYGASSSILSNKELYPLFLRTIQPEHTGNPAKIELMKHLGWSRVATLRSAGDVFSETVGHFSTLMSLENFTILTQEVFSEDSKYQIKKLLDTDARIIYGMFYEDQARHVLCEMNTTDLTIYQAYLQGLYGPKYVWFLPGWYHDNWWDNVDNKTKCTPQQIKMAAGNYFGTLEGLIAKDTSQIMTNGKKRKDVNFRYQAEVTREKLQYSVYFGVAYDAVIAMAITLNKSASILQAQGKSLGNLSHVDKNTSLTFKDILSDLTFIGMSGRVAFDQNGDRIGMNYLLQYQDGKMVTLGYYDASMQKLIMYKDRSIYWPGKSPPKDRLNIKDKQVAVRPWIFYCSVVLSSCGILVSVFFLIYNIQNRNERLIKISSPRINVVILIGCIIIYMVIPLFGIHGVLSTKKQTDVICQLKVWLLNVGFTSLFGALFAKTWRVHIIFTSTSTEKKPIKDRHLLGGVACLLMVDIIILTTWQIISPVVATPHYFDQNKTTRYYGMRCSCETELVWIGLLLGYKGLFLLFGAFLAWETRNISYDELNDSKNIAISIYTIAIATLIGVPVLLFIKGHPDFTFTIMAIFQYYSTSLVIALMFAPKVLLCKKIAPTNHSVNGRVRSISQLPSLHINSVSKNSKANSFLQLDVGSVDSNQRTQRKLDLTAMQNQNSE